MRIKEIEFENFRNFKERGTIKCSTDGKMTIIYGKNGDGKTTLHQLFKWVFYGHVSFNKTANDHLYNLAFEHEQEYGTVFSVMGRIDFENHGQNYSLTRTSSYRKGVIDSELIGEDLTLLKQDEDYDWRRVEKPAETIEKLLPSGLSEYFFFDGESMIADLRVKGKDSASKLKSAIYSMFDLDILEAALNHIGRTDLKTTALGKLYLSKGQIASGSLISAVKTNIESAQNTIDSTTEKIDIFRAEKKEKQDLITNISEQIGSSKSKADYEKQRSLLKKQRDLFLNNAKRDQEHFGDEIMEMFPRILISKAVEDAREKINLKINSSNLPEGINKKIINYLLKEETNTCICGNPLCENEKEHIANYLRLLPPHSYASIYQDFTKTASQWGKGYDSEKIEDIIKRVLDNNNAASQCDTDIRELDEAEKGSKDIEDLVVARKEAEDRIEELDKAIVKLESQNEKYRLYLKKQMAEFDKLTSGNTNNEKINYKIEILKDVEEIIKSKLEQAADQYSDDLEDNIQELLNCMLTSRRRVDVSKDFAVRVMDSYNDESKSEGQFAVVSFAYIGGILNLLKKNQGLNFKEFPLVLDGPFSKLDQDQRQNVVDMLPKFAPQVILFSKDDLHSVIRPDNIGRVWTIQSNEEKNIATVKEGKLWK